LRPSKTNLRGTNWAGNDENFAMSGQQPAASAISGKPAQYFSYNWSGVASTNQLKKSFDKVESCALGISSAK